MPTERSMEKTDADVRRVRRELARLDPWSFWIVPSGAEGLDFSVVGTTGAFAIATCSLEGYVKRSAIRLIVGDRPARGLWRMRRGARKVKHRMLASSVDVPVEPIVCLTRAYPSPATRVRGVRAVGVEQLVKDISERPRIVDPKRAEKVAHKLRSGPAQ
jgi:hypothetical protein